VVAGYGEARVCIEIKKDGEDCYVESHHKCDWLGWQVFGDLSLVGWDGGSS
jgi:hypothetical protein